MKQTRLSFPTLAKKPHHHDGNDDNKTMTNGKKKGKKRKQTSLESLNEENLKENSEESLVHESTRELILDRVKKIKKTTTSSSESNDTSGHSDNDGRNTERKQLDTSNHETQNVDKRLRQATQDSQEDYEIILNHGFVLNSEDIDSAEKETSFVPMECLLLDEGDEAPDFNAVDAISNEAIQLSQLFSTDDFVVLYFFKKSKKSKEQSNLSKDFSKHLRKFSKERNVKVIGICAPQHLPQEKSYKQTIISDTDLSICKSYRCIDSKFKKPQLVTYIIAKHGSDNPKLKIVKIFHKTSSNTLITDILTFIDNFSMNEFEEQSSKFNYQLTHSPIMNSIHDASSKLLASITGETIHDNIVEFISEGEAFQTLHDNCFELIHYLKDLEPKTRKVWEITILYLKKMVVLCQKIHKDYHDQVHSYFHSTNFWTTFWDEVFKIFSELRSDSHLTSLQRHELIHKIISLEKDGNLGSRLGKGRNIFEKKEKKRYLQIVYENFKQRPTREHFIEIERNFFHHCTDKKEEMIEKMIDFWITNLDQHARDVLFVSLGTEDHSKIYQILKLLESHVEDTPEELQAAKIIVSSYPREIQKLCMIRMKTLCCKMLNCLQARIRYLLSSSKEDAPFLEMLTGQKTILNDEMQQRAFVQRLDLRYEEELQYKELKRKHEHVEIPYYVYPAFPKAFQEWTLILREAIQGVISANEDSTKDKSSLTAELRSQISGFLSKAIQTIGEEQFCTVWELLNQLQTSRAIQNDGMGYEFQDQNGSCMVTILLSMKNSK
ncbi:hypothetical protein C9374_002850 [Naegleria lovaniensis]|uniref:Alkyl hydroperoxide reductase subunit C/ Thiol specific antioxidant domain-containing protein n=1 Tax=Naegleria lovaniensis TaxID=51637 RepID=A0AA88GVD1_NAELO|nr:uncharacterized protein C9374_002850 [Naegleria lovaniensis]KAG2386404.1 hypothetical protein C9374_002850 [Naegleria lovaniensis]